LSGAGALQSVQPIAGQRTKISKARCRVHPVAPNVSLPRKARELFGVFTSGKVLGSFIAVADHHQERPKAKSMHSVKHDLFRFDGLLFGTGLHLIYGRQNALADGFGAEWPARVARALSVHHPTRTNTGPASVMVRSALLI